MIEIIWSDLDHSRSSRTSTQTVTATSLGTSSKQSGTTSLTSASLENWTKTSEHLQMYSLSQKNRPSDPIRLVWSSHVFASSHRDGKISREEMIDYFMKASSLLNCKMGFIHTFTESTYVKPTFCEHCAGFVSKHLLLHVNTNPVLSCTCNTFMIILNSKSAVGFINLPGSCEGPQ